MIAGGISVNDIKTRSCSSSSGRTACEGAIDNVVNEYTQGMNEEQKGQFLDKADRLFQEADRICYRDGNTSFAKSYNTGKCVAGIWQNPANAKAGNPDYGEVTPHQREMFKDTGTKAGPRNSRPRPPIKIGDTYEEVSIAAGTTSLADLLTAAKNAVVPPQPQPQPGAVAGAAKFDRDGKLVSEPVAADDPPPSLSGNLSAALIPTLSDSSDNGKMGYSVEGKLRGEVYKDARMTVGVEVRGSVERDTGIPQNPHFAVNPEAVPEHGNAAHIHVKGDAKIAVGGRGVDLPRVNLIATNDQARKLEEILAERWGEKAAKIYMDSFVYPMMAVVGERRERVWQILTKEGADLYEMWLLGTANAAGVAFIDLFASDKKGVIKFLALITGESEEKIYARPNVKAYVDNPALGGSVDELMDELNTITSSQYEMPQDWQNKTDPETLKDNAAYLVVGDYKSKMLGQKEAFLNASGKTDEELKQIAQEKGIPYPFDPAVNPTNPWHAQMIYNDFRAAVAAEGKKASHFITAEGGIIDLNSFYGGASFLVTGGWLGHFVGGAVEAAVRALVSPATTADIIEGEFGGGGGGGAGAKVKYKIYQSKAGAVREASVEGGLLYTDGSQLPEYATPSAAGSLTWGLSDNVTLTLPRGKIAWAFDREGGPNKGRGTVGGGVGYQLNRENTIDLGYDYTRVQSRGGVGSAGCAGETGGLDDVPCISLTTGDTRPQHDVGLTWTRSLDGNQKLVSSIGVTRGSRQNFRGNGDESDELETGDRTQLKVSVGWEF